MPAVLPPCLTLQVEHQQQALSKEGQAQESLQAGAGGKLCSGLGLRWRITK